MIHIVYVSFVLLLFTLLYAAYYLLVVPYLSPLHDLPGPPASGFLGTHLHLLLNAAVSAKETERMVKQYGRTFRILGMGAVRVTRRSLSASELMACGHTA
jgi:hypothetical protein